MTLSTSATGLDGIALRSAFATFATGITVLTVAGPVPRGMTANSFTSVSLDPPLALACVGRDANMHASLLVAGCFGVSVLAAHQEPVARHFADRRRSFGAAQFDAVPWRPGEHTGAPLILGALAWFECRLWRTYDGGDHTIFVGWLQSAVRPEQAPDRGALVFHSGRFRHLP